jgi:DNA helicase-2/ATP-dependent DNA helicase PcrA
MPARGQSSQYDADLVSLRDEIGEARLEDVAALVAQMERLQGVSLRRAEAQGMLVDPAQPYFGHLRLRETDVETDRTREREVCIGRATFVDPEHKVSIVDWRHAPVSQLYYRYGEGSDYEEELGEREVEGEILVRRTVTIEDGALSRIDSPQGVFVKGEHGWIGTEATEVTLAGGQGTATRPVASQPFGVLGTVGMTRAQRLDRHLPEIAALIDRRQFELLTRPSSGVVVIQGGAGSGKTTIGLHRMAYLAYSAPKLFPPERMMVVTYGSALSSYIGELLPSLGVKGVRVVTFQGWAEAELALAIPWLRVRVDDDSSPVVNRVKSHPALLGELERRARKLRTLPKDKRGSRAIIELWAELLTDRARLLELCCGAVDFPLRERDVDEAHGLMSERVAAVMDREPREKVVRQKPVSKESKARTRDHALEKQVDPSRLSGAAMRAYADAAGSPMRDYDEEEEGEGDETVRGDTGIDGLATAGEEPVLDLGDVAMILRANQIVRGARKQLAHLFVDEAQDLSPVELAVLIGETEEFAGGRRGGQGDETTTRSLTLAGDTSQRLFLDNGFRDWRTVLHELHLDHVAIEPLRISYRSTREILQLARHAMGPLADPLAPEAKRSGAPVEAHRFPGTGPAVAFLAEALRPLFVREPRATVALLARHPEQADRYFDGLKRAEIPSLRRVRAQDFAFRPGVEVTEIRQVKGLEFDYVIIVDANASSFGTDDESRHLFHIAATRAAHQLWLVVTAAPSPLFPPELLAR